MTDSEHKTYKPVVLVSMDGVGVATPGKGNAVTSAQTPNLDQYWPNYPHGYLNASQEAVGLPEGADGNSEVGHTVMGAGKALSQDVTRINNAIEDKTFFENPEIKKAFQHAKDNVSNVHLLGLIGEGNVHSDVDHLYALLNMAKQEDVDPEKVYIHVITDGRDSPTDEAYEYIAKVKEQCTFQRMGKIASVVGRYYAMDRDKRWERTEMAYNLYTKGEGHVIVNLEKAIQDSYKEGVYDEFLEPMVWVEHEDDKFTPVGDNDTVIFFNFRPDRAVQLTRAFEEEDFTGFERKKLENLYFLGMTKYSPDFPTKVVFEPDKAEKHLGKVLEENHKKQLRVAESEKFAHVTYFFNNGQYEAGTGETQIEVPSPQDVETYDEKPEMSQYWVTDVLVEKLSNEDFDFALVNFAAPDMVGHTGNYEAAIQAMEAVDECVGRVVNKVLELGGAVVVTADHGNAEDMIDERTGMPNTHHTTNPVPVLVIAEDMDTRELPMGDLADLAPTVLGLMGIKQPAEMTGKNLLELGKDKAAD